MCDRPSVYVNVDEMPINLATMGTLAQTSIRRAAVRGLKVIEMDFHNSLLPIFKVLRTVPERRLKSYGILLVQLSVVGHRLYGDVEFDGEKLLYKNAFEQN